ncbi:MAG: type 1 glutamine amidotransferase domain-containing protein [Myxococcota bacterium]|nr:type 1 glutamine amidotransferase domain-containing protein [Myxococcota bacterium]
MARVLIATADRGFDPTEVAVPWRILTAAGHTISFATTTGRVGVCDPLTLMGPPAFSKFFAAQPDGVRSYHQMEACEAFQTPLTYDDVVCDDYDALLLPGGHAVETKPYLESARLQQLAMAFLDSGRVVGAICHGPLVLARARRSDGRSPLAGRKMTALTWTMEMSAWAMTAWKLGTHYRIYPTPVQTEVVTALGREGQFETGPLLPSYDRPFVITDDNLISARWPGDAAAWAHTLVEALAARQPAPQ